MSTPTGEPKTLADEQAVFACARCGVPILTWWDPRGRGLLRGEYVLVGDFILHPRCWEALVEEEVHG